MFICSDEKENKIAIIRFDIEGNTAEVSINLNSYKRNIGLAKICLNGSINYIRKSLTKIHTLKAEIKNNNIPSKKVFEGIGFQYQFEDENICHYQMSLK